MGKKITYKILSCTWHVKIYSWVIFYKFNTIEYFISIHLYNTIMNKSLKTNKSFALALAQVEDFFAEFCHWIVRTALGYVAQIHNQIESWQIL